MSDVALEAVEQRCEEIAKKYNLNKKQVEDLYFRRANNSDGSKGAG